MATNINLTYLGGLRCEMIHEKSGEKIITDAPTDNHGKGEAFSPTDLIGASLLSCMVTVMGIEAEKQGWMMGEVNGSLQKTMDGNPRKVKEMSIQIVFNNHGLTPEQREVLEQKAINCPVALSLHPDITYPTIFIY